MIIAPSLLAANYGRFADEVRRVDRSGSDWLHVDVMDGNFVPNISFGPGLVKTLRPLTRLPFDVHLMCARPEILLEPFAQSGADWITVHIELGDQVTPLLWKIRSLGKKVGLAINPPTPATAVEPLLKYIDLLLVMTVNPGFGGQIFIKESYNKIIELRKMIDNGRYNVLIEVDGGIDTTNAIDLVEAGANVLVAGSSVFKSKDPAKTISRLKKLF